MTRGNTQETKIHFQGNQDDYIIYAESVEAVQKWKDDKTVPLVDVVNSFDIFVTHKQGAQGIFDRASKAQLESEFGSTKDDEIVKQILEKGKIVQEKSSSKEADKNPTNGPGVSSMGPVHN